MTEKQHAPALRATLDECLEHMNREIEREKAKLPGFAQRAIDPLVDRLRGWHELTASELVKMQARVDRLAQLLEEVDDA